MLVVASTSNSFYSFVGLPNPTDVDASWDSSPPDPRDSFDEENNYWDTMIALKKIDADDVKQVIKKLLGDLVQLMICTDTMLKRKSFKTIKVRLVYMKQIIM